MSYPRQLTAWEIARFLARHPIVGTRVAQTKAAMSLGLYDVNAYDSALVIKFPGVIEPWGIQVEDSEFQMVTIQPAANMQMYFAGFSPDLPAINEPEFESPSGNSLTQTLEDTATAIKGALTTVLVVGVVVYLGGQYLGRK